MSTSTQNTSEKSIPPALIAVIAIALILFIGWRAWAAFGSPSTGSLPPPPTQEINYINAKARECQGDFSKLAPDDQTKVQQISRGMGAANIASTWRELSSKSH